MCTLFAFCIVMYLSLVGCIPSTFFDTAVPLWATCSYQPCKLQLAVYFLASTSKFHDDISLLFKLPKYVISVWAVFLDIKFISFLMYPSCSSKECKTFGSISIHPKFDHSYPRRWQLQG